MSDAATTANNAVKFERIPAYSWWVLIASMLCFMCFFVAMNATAVFGTLIQSRRLWN